MSLGVSARLVERFGSAARARRRAVGHHRRARAARRPGRPRRATSRACSSPFLLLGLGAGASFLPLLTMGMSDAPTRDAGLASGIINVSVQLFGAIGLATLGTIATDHTKALSASGQPLAERADRRLPPRLSRGRGCASRSASSRRCCCCARPPTGRAGDGRGASSRDRAAGGPSPMPQPQAAWPSGRPELGRQAAQRGPPDLAAGGLRQLLGEVDDARVLVGRGLALDVLLQLARERGGGRVRRRAARRPRARPRRAPRRAPPPRRPRRRPGGRRAPTRPRTARCGSRRRRSRRRCAPRSTASRRRPR